MQVPLGREMTSFSFIGSQTLKNGSKSRLWRRKNTLETDKPTFGDKRIDESPKPTKMERRSEKKKKSINPQGPKSMDENSEERTHNFATAVNKMKGHQNGNPKCGFRVCEPDEG